MIQLTNIDSFLDYCYRKLGAPVINIEMDYDQAVDRVEDALQYFMERHYDGTEEVWNRYVVTQDDVKRGHLVIPESLQTVVDLLQPQSLNSVEAFDNIQFQMVQQSTDLLFSTNLSEYYIGRQHLALMNSMFNPKKTFNFNKATNKLIPKFTLTDVGSINLLPSADAWVVTNGTLAENSVDGATLGTLNGSTLTSSAAGVVSVSKRYTTKGYARGTFTFKNAFMTPLNASVTISIADGDGKVAATKTITSNSIWNEQFVYGTMDNTFGRDIVVTVSYTALAANEIVTFQSPALYMNAFLILHGFQVLDEAADLNVWDDRWLKQYATALLKRQWGSNVKKFDGVQLPGGLTMNGQQIFDEAVEEISKLEEEFSLSYELPVQMSWG